LCSPAAGLGADLTTYEGVLAAQYLSSVKAGWSANYPDLLYAGPDVTGTYWTPPSGAAIQADNQYLDIVFQAATSIDAEQDAEQIEKYQFFTHYFTKPMVLFVTTTSAQSNYGCNSNVMCWATQAARGTAMYNSLNNGLTTLSFNGTIQQTGYVWWASQDNSVNENINWGLKTNLGNAYDGIEDVAASIPCAAPLTAFTCGGESRASWNGANLIGGSRGLQAGNALWFAGSFIPTVALKGQVQQKGPVQIH
jgi:hypothetical protein